MTWRIIEGDCLQVLPTLTETVDAVVTDPPYGVGKAEWDGAIPPPAIWQETARLLRPGGSLLVFGGLRHMPSVMSAIGDSLQYEWVIAWYKSNAMQFGKTGFNVLDLVLWYSKGGAVASGRMRDVIEYPIIPSENDFGHPSPKPVPVMKQLINMVDGATILDPFCGSGTTGVACIKTGRNFIGIEIDHGYAEIARRRCEEAAMQGRLELP